ncbi:rhodanese-like domain-containing protein [Algoriphagus aquimarinus]|uniref:Rhodanese-related sulfurtransferase n=1 Tax=Algoriphagus aquimarinus TaxID=237018 RepID=A0A1I0XPR1_9BACT|nr:rhodanese-like domain-containing protein [Algoriphagus aquimarinus]SFB02446.1 Rhodanese-related sulfurtransferase [Algoriphagus aquimarinus]|tara:strand:- start:293264 stop:293560 length:297 start_codon:yes stop_codon:yes gene_type:complete
MEDITVEDLKSRLDNNEKFVFLDVREEWEYEDDNLGAKNIPLADLPTRLEELEDYKDTEIVVHCRSGARSMNAKKFLETKGFSKVRNTTGGILAYRNL